MSSLCYSPFNIPFINVSYTVYLIIFLVKGSETENGEINENNQVYCVADIVEWNVKRGNNTSWTRQYIKEIRIMNEKDIEEEEMKEVTKEEKTP